MSLMRKSLMKKHMAIIQSTIGLSACCMVLSSCGSSSSGSYNGGSNGTANMTLEVDKWDNGVWEEIDSAALYELHCRNGDSDYKLRLVNNGTGSLKTVGTTVSVSKTTSYAGGPMNGSAGDFTFAVHTQPTMPVVASTSSEFIIRLSNANGDCMLGGTGHNHEGVETALVTINTDDPTNPTFNATLKVFGSS